MASESCKALCGCVFFPQALTKAFVGDPILQDALVQSGLQELQGSLRLCTRSAGSDQGAVGDHGRQEAVVQHCLQELQGSLRHSLAKRARADVECPTYVLALRAGTGQLTV